MKEPNLEATIEFLFNAGYDVEDKKMDDAVIDRLFDNHNASKNSTNEFEQILYFCRKEQASTVVNEINSIDDSEKKRKVISSLISIYPISKHVIFKMLNRADIYPKDFLEVFDFNDCLVDSIKKSLDVVTKNSSANNIKLINYEKEIDALEKQIATFQNQKEELIKSITDYEDKLSKKKCLEEEICNLQQMRDQGWYDDIESKKIECARLQKEKDEKDQERQCLVDEISELKEYLSRKDDESDDGEYKKALKALEMCVKAIDKKVG